MDLSPSSSPSFCPLDTRAPGWTFSVTTVSSFTVAPIEGMGTSIRKVSIRVIGANRGCGTERGQPQPGGMARASAGPPSGNRPPYRDAPGDKRGEVREGDHVRPVARGALGV